MRRALTALLVMVTFASLLVAAADSAAATTFVVRLHASDSTVALGSKVTISGVVSPLPSRRRVSLQQRVNAGTWTTMKTVTTKASGAFSVSLKPGRISTRDYRIHVPARAGRTATDSAWVTVTIAAKPSITGLSAGAGPLSGGSTIRVDGSTLSTATSVTFTPALRRSDLAKGFTSAPAVAASFTVAGSTLQVVVPAGLGGKSTLRVRTDYGTASTGYRYQRTSRSPTTMEGQILDAINVQRSQQRTCNGKVRKAVRPLTWDGGLSDLALSHSRDLASRQTVYHGLTHVTYGTKDFATRFRLAGITSGYLGEILALTPVANSAEAVVGAWMASTAGHCDAVMSSTWTRAGVGLATGTGSGSDWRYSNVDFG